MAVYNGVHPAPSLTALLIVAFPLSSASPDIPAPRPYGEPPLDADRLRALVAALEASSSPRTAAVVREIAGEIERWGSRRTGDSLATSARVSQATPPVWSVAHHG